jgi:hypothetical protein
MRGSQIPVLKFFFIFVEILLLTHFNFWFYLAFIT